MKIALVIGHKESSQGACNENGMCEFEYNEQLVKLIQYELKDHPTIDTFIVYRESYRELPDKINELEPNYIISFHCNAFNKQVSGTEILYYHKSSIGKSIAEELQKVVVNTLGLYDRGIKPKTSEDRGGYLLKYTHAPCVMLESFFIDNNQDLICGMDLIDKLAEDISEFIIKIKGV